MNYKGYKIKIYVDYDPINPRENDNLSVMACIHRRYNLGDYKHPASDIILEEKSFNEGVRKIRKQYDVALLKPLYLYEHSGITISTEPFSCRWDSCCVGFVFVTKDAIRDMYGVKRVSKEVLKKAEDVLEAEVDEYDIYIRGDVFGFQVISPSGDIIDSCFGFVGHDHSDSGLLECAECEIDYHIEQIKTAYFKKVKQLIKASVPLSYREGLLIQLRENMQ